MMTTTRSSEQKAERGEKARIPNAIALLKADHRAVEDLFEEYEHARQRNRKQAIVRQICEELTLHAQLEEEAFYPAAQKALADDKDLVNEAIVEHASLKWLISQIEGMQDDSEMYAAEVTVLKEYVQHHVKEEEKEMFPRLRKTDLDLDALGQTLFEAKQQLKKS